MSFLRRRDNLETGFSTLHFEPAAHGEYTDASGTRHAFEVAQIESTLKLHNLGGGVPRAMRFCHEGFPRRLIGIEEVAYNLPRVASDARRSVRGDVDAEALEPFKAEDVKVIQTRRDAGDVDVQLRIETASGEMVTLTHSVK